MVNNLAERDLGVLRFVVKILDLSLIYLIENKSSVNWILCTESKHEQLELTVIGNKIDYQASFISFP